MLFLVSEMESQDTQATTKQCSQSSDSPGKAISLLQSQNDTTTAATIHLRYTCYGEVLPVPVPHAENAFS